MLNQPNLMPMMPSGSGSLGGGGPVNLPFGGGMGGRGGGRTGPDTRPPAKMMRMGDTGLLFVIV